MGILNKMTDQSKKAKGTKDYISQIKKDSEVTKEVNQQVADEEWYRNASDDEEETTQSKSKVIEQGKVESDKPKKLKDIFGQSNVQKPRNKRPADSKKPADFKDGEPRKPKFTNSRGQPSREEGFKQQGFKTTGGLEKPVFHNTW